MRPFAPVSRSLRRWPGRRRALRCLGTVTLAAPLLLGAWEGHDWNQWREVTTWQKPAIHTDQSNRRDLVPLLGESPDTNRIASLDAWKPKRRQLAAAIGQILGAPANLQPPPVEVRELAVEPFDGYTRRQVRIRSEPDDWIPAYLLVPKTPRATPAPAVICLHQTVAQGKDEPCGIRGDPELAFAVELVQRGYVCVAPDMIGFGERIPPGKQPYDNSLAFYRKHPNWSFFGKMIWDIGRIVDYLETLPFVDARRIGSIGHSHGGYGTLFAMAFEPRLAAAVASCAFTTFRADPHPERWSHLTALLPQLGFYLPDVASIPFDWQHVLALAAPRNLYVWFTTNDAIFPNTTNLDALLSDVRGVYRLHGAESALVWRSAGGPHRFPKAERETAYQWLDTVLTRASPAASAPGPPVRGETNPAAPAPAVPLQTNSTPPPRTRPVKSASAFFPEPLVARARANASNHTWAAQIRDALLAAARPWREMSDDQLWELMFGNTLKRAWQVWSDGHCPSCKKPVPMYQWIADALNHPWKMRCPHCKELFPKNDFAAFYRSGLDAHHVFDPQRADRSLLFNTEHPNPSDPLHRFGVDDGDGYVADGKRWRFINAYLIYGQWKQAVVGGIRNLAAAYVVTGDPVYAHKAGVLLDRVADLYPTFDFGREGVMYEGPPRAGYVSTWHDACVEVRDLALAYDAVFDALARDAEMVEFLAVKAARFKPPLPKNSFADIQRNIEERIFRDTLANRPKIESNYPATDTTVLILHTVLGWPANRPQVLSLLDAMLEKATAVDGLTGEKGLTGYSAIAPREIAELLGRYARTDPAFLPEVLGRHPRLHAMYRFHLDTRCLDYYPRTGDTGAFATKNPAYPAVHFTRNPGIQPSAFAFLAELAHATGDLDFVRLLYEANGKSVDGLPWDLFADDPGRFQSNVLAVIREHGAEIRLSSVNKTQWALAILRAGEGPHARAAWLDYDSGERHGHADGLTLGLFAKGLDLLPDFGYPPVQFGGWLSPRARWYSQTPAHNTVSVDGQDTRTGTGRTTLWFDGDQLRAVRASAPALIAGSQFERTLLMVDLSPADSYLVDIFRVAGGREHTRFFHGHFGTLKPERLAPQPVTETRYGELMRNFRRDPQPAPGWSVTWLAHDQLQYLPPGRQVRLRLTDLTRDAEVDLAESWVSVGLYDSTADTWIPSVLVRRRSQTPPLSSTFAGVLEPFEGEPLLRNIRRLRPTDPNGNERPDSDVALEVELADGRRDLILALDTERRAAADGDVVVALGGRDIRLRGELCLVRFNTAQAPERLVLCRGQTLRAGEVTLQLKDPAASVEVDLTPPDAPRIRGETGALESLEIAGRRVLPK